MREKSEDIVTYTGDELKVTRDRGEARSDFAKAAAHPLPDGSEPDDAMEEVDWATTELPMPRRKAHASLRLDADMLDWFKAQGRGYQTRINAVSRGYFQQHVRGRR
jgi:uncharacterized protein (DUF4415 family)